MNLRSCRGLTFRSKWPIPLLAGYAAWRGNYPTPNDLRAKPHKAQHQWRIGEEKNVAALTDITGTNAANVANLVVGDNVAIGATSRAVKTQLLDGIDNAAVVQRSGHHCCYGR